MIEFERGAPVIVDRSLYRELAKDAIRTGVEQLREKAAAVEAERKQARRRTNDTPADRLEEAHREESRQLREIAERAHGVNLDLGASLLNGLAAVDPASIDVVIWRRRRASSTSRDLASPASFEALSDARLQRRPRRWSGGCRISIEPAALSPSPRLLLYALCGRLALRTRPRPLLPPSSGLARPLAECPYRWLGGVCNVRNEPTSWSCCSIEAATTDPSLL